MPLLWIMAGLFVYTVTSFERKPWVEVVLYRLVWLKTKESLCRSELLRGYYRDMKPVLWVFCKVGCNFCSRSWRGVDWELAVFSKHFHEKWFVSDIYIEWGNPLFWWTLNCSLFDGSKTENLKYWGIFFPQNMKNLGGSHEVYDQLIKSLYSSSCAIDASQGRNHVCVYRGSKPSECIFCLLSKQ